MVLRSNGHGFGQIAHVGNIVRLYRGNHATTKGSDVDSTRSLEEESNEDTPELIAEG